MSIKKILSPINDHMKNVDLVIKSSLHSEIPVINKISSHIINSGGKKLRPALHILVAGWLGKINKKNYQLAAILEFIHTATLLHDDVVDESSRQDILRQPTQFMEMLRVFLWVISFTQDLFK